MSEAMGRRFRRRAGRGARAIFAVVAVLWPAVPARALDLGIHNDGAGGAYETNPCRSCHNTAAGAVALRGWAISYTLGGTGWPSKGLSYLCYTCHDNTGGVLITDAHDMSNNAFADSSHSYVIAEAPKEPEGSDAGTSQGDPRASGLPYMLAPSTQMECTTCHNVHVAAHRPFLHRADLQGLCAECHGGRANDGSLDTLSGTLRSYSTHPTRQALGDTARANVKLLAEIGAALKVDILDAPNYALGGHLYPSVPEGLVDCQTCHAVHGPAQGTAGTPGLLAIHNNTTHAEASALCEGCHWGGDAGEQVGTVAQSGLLAGEFSDHPIDSRGNRAFYPTGAALPASWLEAGTPNRDRGAQPFTSAAAAAPVCSSCHDTHGGIAGTPLLRGPQPGGTFDPLSYGDWCFACHTAAQVLPPAHHSVINSLSTAGGDAMDSQLACGDCHGPAGATTWSAHNGFWEWSVAVSATDSALCEACHSPADPTDLVSPALKGQSFTEPAGFPAAHGTARGTASHYLGADSNEHPGVDPKTTAWSSGYFSSYGAPNTGGGGDVEPAGAGAVICESCHNMVFNDGRFRPASYGDGSTVKAGWRSNLLLEPYADDPPGLGDGSTGSYAVGSALCTGCHTRIGIQHPMGTADVVSLSGLAPRTGAGSFANQGGAPNALSYPDDNLLDCDSCHRPHRADSDSDVAGASHGGGASSDGLPTRHILEIDDPGHVYSPMCAECHGQY